FGHAYCEVAGVVVNTLVSQARGSECKLRSGQGYALLMSSNKSETRVYRFLSKWASRKAYLNADAVIECGWCSILE
ncbi:hypothetical protein EG68_04395, partial [Paragonimus skrjabini miyazakii]